MKIFLLFFLVSCQFSGADEIFMDEAKLKGCDEVHLFAPLRCLPGATFEGCTESLLKEVKTLGATTLLINRNKDNFVAEEILGRAFNCPKK